MMTFSTRILPLLLLGTVVAVVGSVVAYAVMASASLPDGPVDIVWDKAACAACGMHVGEPPFAAQLTTKDGHTHAFDDPGCLFVYVDENHPEVHAIWFRHHREDRWLAGDSVGFAPVEVTPMGFGLGAVDAATPGAIDLDDARRRCIGRTGGHGGR